MYIYAREEGEGGKTNLCEGRRGREIDKYVQEEREREGQICARGEGRGKRQIICVRGEHLRH